MKICKKCNVERDVSLFYKAKGTLDGMRESCKICMSNEYKDKYNESPEKFKVKSAKYREEFPEKAKEAMLTSFAKNGSTYRETGKLEYHKNKSEICEMNRSRHRKDPRKAMLQAARRRATIKGLAFDIELSDIEIPIVCPMLGIPLKVSTGKPNKNSPSLDRIIPALGYVKGNVKVISHMANTMKNSATPNELITFATYILENFTQLN